MDLTQRRRPPLYFAGRARREQRNAGTDGALFRRVGQLHQAHAGLLVVSAIAHWPAFDIAAGTADARAISSTELRTGMDRRSVPGKQAKTYYND